MPDINVNLVNDIGCNAIQEALRKKNKEAVKILAKRKDMKFTKDDVATARGLGIDLEKEASASCEKQETVGATLSDTLKSIFSWCETLALEHVKENGMTYFGRSVFFNICYSLF